MYQPFALRSPHPRHMATSPGERLWFAIRDWWFAAEAEFGLGQNAATLRWTDRRGRIALARSGASISETCVRLIGQAKSTLSRCDLGVDVARAYADEVAADVKQFCVSPMGISFADPVLPIFGELAFQCAVVARQEISTSTRRYINNWTISRAGQVGCYMCGDWLSGQYALDHLWPQSLGGISTEDNLLPVCDRCNGLKMDKVNWDVYGVVTDYSWLRHGHEGARLTDMALHRRAAGRLAELEETTLQQAFVRLGPIKTRQNIDPDDRDDWFYNITAHDTAVLPALWD